MVVAIDRWLLFGGGRLLKLDCTSKVGHNFVNEIEVELHFINVLIEAFAQTEPKSVKRWSRHQSFYAYGICRVKAGRKYAGEIGP
jgi:hypothetical protein